MNGDNFRPLQRRDLFRGGITVRDESVRLNFPEKGPVNGRQPERTEQLPVRFFADVGENARKDLAVVVQVCAKQDGDAPFRPLDFPIRRFIAGGSHFPFPKKRETSFPVCVQPAPLESRRAKPVSAIKVAYPAANISGSAKGRPLRTCPVCWLALTPRRKGKTSVALVLLVRSFLIRGIRSDKTCPGRVALTALPNVIRQA